MESSPGSLCERALHGGRVEGGAAAGLLIKFGLRIGHHFQYRGIQATTPYTRRENYFKMSEKDGHSRYSRVV